MTKKRKSTQESPSKKVAKLDETDQPTKADEEVADIMVEEAAPEAPPVASTSRVLPKVTLANPDCKHRYKQCESGCDESIPVRIYMDGIFDLFHYGHARALEQGKKLLPNAQLVVGSCSDEMTHTYKGRTVMTDVERYESLRHCKWVDEVITDAPWVVTQEFLDEHKIDYVAHDALPYGDATGQAADVYQFVKEQGRFLETKRTESVSTSDIVTRIIIDYEAFVRRNLERGYSRKDLNVSLWREGKIKAKSKMKELGEEFDKTVAVYKRKMAHLADAVFGHTAKKFSDSFDKSMKEINTKTDELGDSVDKWISGFLDAFGEQGVQGVVRKTVTELARPFSPRSPQSPRTLPDDDEDKEPMPSTSI
eukprot:GFYU01001208.1.p1 GENE.GFYU01001208.1~~GFYU01001208.1.p1  ORF type:complete len:365 (-),score=114.00 GFYU01001208.1:1402-2496(-)